MLLLTYRKYMLWHQHPCTSTAHQRRLHRYVLLSSMHIVLLYTAYIGAHSGHSMTCVMAYLCVCGQNDRLVIRLVKPTHQLGQQLAAGDARRTPDSSGGGKIAPMHEPCHWHKLGWQLRHTVYTG
jgi:hypothetical protein